jgi:hypothetical protein
MIIVLCNSNLVHIRKWTVGQADSERPDSLVTEIRYFVRIWMNDGYVKGGRLHAGVGEAGRTGLEVSVLVVCRLIGVR